MKPNSALAGAVLAAAVTLSGCSMAPRLTIPDVPTAAVYKEAGPWTPAQPADGVDHREPHIRDRDIGQRVVGADLPEHEVGLVERDFKQVWRIGARFRIEARIKAERGDGAVRLTG